MINTATLPPAATGNNGPIRSPSPAPRAHTHIIDSFIIASQLRRRGTREEGERSTRRSGRGRRRWWVSGVVRIKPTTTTTTHPQTIDFITVELPLGRSHSQLGRGLNASVCVCVCVCVCDCQCVHHDINLG